MIRVNGLTPNKFIVKHCFEFLLKFSESDDKMKFFLALVIFITVEVFGDKARYDNYRIYAVDINNEIQLQILKAIHPPSRSDHSKLARSY